MKNFEEKTIEYEITTPSKKFPGVKLGSLRFVKKSTDKGKQKGLVPEYARVVAIMLTEDGEKFNQGADLHLKKVNLKLSNGQKVIAARIQNDQPKVIQELSINGKVKKKGSKSTVASQKVKDFSVAPNSNFDFEIPLSIKKFGAGTYEFTGVASANGKKWNWKKEFTVGNEQAKKVNEESVYKLRTPSWAPIVTVALIVSLIGLIAFLIRRQSIWTKRGL